MKRGARKFFCGDCGNEQPIHWVERERRFKPRCQKCGSLRLEPKTVEGKDSILEEGNRRIAHSGENADLPGAGELTELIEFLRHRNWVIRRRAAKAVGQLGAESKRAIPELQRLLRDQHETVRKIAAWAIDQIEGEPKKD